MSRVSTRSEAFQGGAPAAGSRADACIRVAAGVTVAGLAGIAGAISYSHMQELAAAHGETGWQAHAFPLSADGIEVVASLVLLADRRLGRRSGWLPWAALAAGTTASLAANVAAAGAGPVGRVIAGWPAFAPAGTGAAWAPCAGSPPGFARTPPSPRHHRHLTPRRQPAGSSPRPASSPLTTAPRSRGSPPAARN
jgi:Protein of unknown function (DUF2637)